MTAGRRAALGRLLGGRARLSLHPGVRLRYEAGHPGPVSHTAARIPTRCPLAPVRQLTTGEPELDLADRGIGRIRAVNEVVLSDQGQVTADGAGRGLLDGIRPAGDLAKRRNGPRALHDGRHDG